MMLENYFRRYNLLRHWAYQLELARGLLSRRWHH